MSHFKFIFGQTKKHRLGLMPIIPELMWLRQEKCEFKASLGYIIRLSFLKKLINKYSVFYF
jgi:hypothetical protein